MSSRRQGGTDGTAQRVCGPTRRQVADGERDGCKGNGAANAPTLSRLLRQGAGQLERAAMEGLERKARGKAEGHREEHTGANRCATMRSVGRGRCKHGWQGGRQETSQRLPRRQNGTTREMPRKTVAARASTTMAFAVGD
ncbi:hypothetical protein ERJ75_001397900 [Trypanosoma vivax]|nr:hypothetical protein ERJ75_001397900 [Trypanosoma vivax]